MSAKIFEAKSVEEALSEAATALGVAASDLEHEVVEEKSDDFWGLGETVLAVRVWVPGAEPEPEPEPAPEPEAPESEAAASPPESEPEPEAVAEATPESSDEPAAQAAPSTPEAAADDVPDFFSEGEAPEQAAESSAPEPEPAAPAGVAAEAAPAPRRPRDDAPLEGGADLGDEAVELLDRVFGAMGFECGATAKLDGETLHVAITGEDNAYLLEGRGRGLSALELVLNHAFRHRDDRGHRRVRVDAGDFRNQREEELRDIAFQVAHQAKETRQPQQTESLNPYERRIVHLTLADDSNVTTRSLGNGFMKVVSVIPTGGGHRRR